jgi:hypothetical protein
VVIVGTKSDDEGCLNSMKAFVCDEGLARFCTVKIYQ